MTIFFPDNLIKILRKHAVRVNLHVCKPRVRGNLISKISSEWLQLKPLSVVAKTVFPFQHFCTGEKIFSRGWFVDDAIKKYSFVKILCFKIFFSSFRSEKRKQHHCSTTPQVTFGNAETEKNFPPDTRCSLLFRRSIEI